LRQSFVEVALSHCAIERDYVVADGDPRALCFAVGFNVEHLWLATEVGSRCETWAGNLHDFRG
jgi:hypothetical protein